MKASIGGRKVALVVIGGVLLLALTVFVFFISRSWKSSAIALGIGVIVLIVGFLLFRSKVSAGLLSLLGRGKEEVRPVDAVDALVTFYYANFGYDLEVERYSTFYEGKPEDQSHVLMACVHHLDGSDLYENIKIPLSKGVDAILSGEKEHLPYSTTLLPRDVQNFSPRMPYAEKLLTEEAVREQVGANFVSRLFAPKQEQVPVEGTGGVPR